MAFTIKENDTRPAYVAALKDDYGLPSESAINLTAATSVKFKMRPVAGGALKVDGTMTIVSAAAGTVQYVWIAADTDTVGTFDVEYEITWSDGGVETVPNDGYDTVIVVDDLDA